MIVRICLRSKSCYFNKCSQASVGLLDIYPNFRRFISPLRAAQSPFQYIYLPELGSCITFDFRLEIVIFRELETEVTPIKEC